MIYSATGDVKKMQVNAEKIMKPTPSVNDRARINEKLNLHPSLTRRIKQNTYNANVCIISVLEFHIDPNLMVS